LENYKVEIPSPVEINTAYGTLSVTASIVDGILKIQQQRTIKAGRYPLEEYSDLYDFIKTSEKISKKFLIVCTPE